MYKFEKPTQHIGLRLVIYCAILFLVGFNIVQVVRLDRSLDEVRNLGSWAVNGCPKI